MGDPIVCLSRGEVVLFLFPIIMFTLYVAVMCWVTKKQCREDGFCVGERVLVWRLVVIHCGVTSGL